MARTKKTARMSAGPPTRCSKRQIFGVKAHSFSKNKCGEYIVRCGDTDCDEVLLHGDKLLTTYTEHGEDRHYHIDCYTKTDNFTRYHWPNATNHIDNWTNLSLTERIEYESKLFKFIKPNKHQLFKLDCNIYHMSCAKLIRTLRERDIEIYSQTSLFEEPGVWNRDEALIRLRNFYQQKECEHKLKSLVNGYIRFNIITNQNDQMPVALKSLIVKYSKIYF